MPKRREALGKPGSRPRGTRLGLAGHDEIDRADEEQGQDYARKDTRHEQAPDGLLGEHGIDDHAAGRRDQEAERAPGSDGSGREAVGVLVSLHFRQSDAAHRDGGCQRRPRKRSKASAGRYGCRGQPAAQVPHPAIGGGEQVVRHARNAGKVAHQHEHRDHEQVEIRCGFEGLAGQVRIRDLPSARPGLFRVHSDEDELVGVCNRRPDEPDAQHRESDRHPQCQQDKQGQEPDQAKERHADHSGSLPTFSLTTSLERASCQISSRSIAA